MSTKTASIRLDKKLYDRIDSLCDDEGCSRNDFIKSAIESALNNKKDDVVDHEPYYDSHGNYWYWNENRKIWTCKLNPDNIRIID